VVLTTHPILAPMSRKGRAITSIHPPGQFSPVTGVLYLYFYISTFHNVCAVPNMAVIIIIIIIIITISATAKTTSFYEDIIL
jgi:hypothetical protein